MTWKELETGWLDTETGLIWDKVAKMGVNHYQAEEYAKAQGKRLPTKEEFEIAEKHGIREVIPEMKNQFASSSTVYPGDSGNAYVFYGGYGNFYDVNCGSSLDGGAARCLSPAGAVSGVPGDSNSDSLPERVLRAKALLLEALELLK